MKSVAEHDIEFKAATHLASVEIIVGSLGHGFKIPFTGTFLSFYQLYICLDMVLRSKAASIRVFNVSVIVAMLKILSPFGKKLTPMIAISMQGFLFWLGSVLLRDSLLGVLIGSILFVSWSLIQSILGYVILYGFDFFKMIEFLQQEWSGYISVNIYMLIAGYWVMRVLVAVGLIIYLETRSSTSQAWRLDESFLARMQSRVKTTDKSADDKPAWRRAIKDLINPYFFLSLIFMSLFHFYKDSSWNQLIWFVCQTITVGFLLFYLVRSDWLKRKLLRWFGRNRKFRSLYRKMYRVKQGLGE